MSNNAAVAIGPARIGLSRAPTKAATVLPRSTPWSRLPIIQSVARANKQPIFFLPFVAVDAEAYAATQIVALGERTMRNDQPLLALTRAATLKMGPSAKARLMRGIASA